MITAIGFICLAFGWVFLIVAMVYNDDKPLSFAFSFFAAAIAFFISSMIAG